MGEAPHFVVFRVLTDARGGCCGLLVMVRHLWTQALSAAHVQEICRFGAAELHTEAAFVGGAVAQVVTMVVSKQFRPIEGVLLHNGINGATSMLELVD